ncbi:MAG: RnfABCDGE type electron transport complex subunit G [Prevotella sp.]|nr:RnfABCDGE type electron transport complex subunit G [Prevotella sp.]
MKKLESTITNMVLSLVCVALITGSILAYVNKVTEAPIKAQAEKALADGIKTVMQCNDLKVQKTDTVKQDVNGKELTYVIYNTEDNNGKYLGAAVESVSSGFGGDIKILVGFNEKGDILGYTLLSHAETPGLGAKADKWFQADGKGNIINRNPGEKELVVNKDGGDVESITASTITTRAFLNAVNQAYKAYMALPIDANTSATAQSEN